MLSNEPPLVPLQLDDEKLVKSIVEGKYNRITPTALIF